MQRLVVSALLAAPVIATKCSVGNKHKADLTGKFCSSSAADAASCDATCCETNKDTCGGSGVICPFGTYAAGDDAWKSKKTTAKTKVADCCAPTATCDNTLYTCPAGFKKTTNAVAKKTKCSSGPKSCAVKGACCEADDTTCGGYQDKNGNGVCTPAAEFESVTFATTDDVWRKKKLSAATVAKFGQECCVAKATCSSLTCKAGYKASTVNKNKVIGAVNGATTKPFSKYESATVNAADACCVIDVAKKTCGTSTVSCSAGTYKPSSYDDVAVPDPTKANSFCCVPTATCSAATCPSGYKMKANVATVSCHGDHLACVTGNTCCEVDKTTCGGISASTGISCPYGFYDESATWVLSGDGKTSQATKDAWNKLPATEATKNTACCTAAAECKVEVGTTTPAPAVTTTPAVPV